LLQCREIVWPVLLIVSRMEIVIVWLYRHGQTVVLPGGYKLSIYEYVCDTGLYQIQFCKQ
jgi:hypothetical protein